MSHVVACFQQLNEDNLDENNYFQYFSIRYFVSLPCLSQSWYSFLDAKGGLWWGWSLSDVFFNEAGFSGM